MSEWEVTLEKGALDIGPWRCPTGWQGRVTADDRETAIERAREKCAETFDRDMATGKVKSVEQLHVFAVTLRGRHDKRRRETFMVLAANERDATRDVFYMPAALQFAGYRSRKRDPLVKVERLNETVA